MIMPDAIQLSTGARFLANPAVDRGKPYGAAERAILSLDGARAAHAAISAWDGYGPTPPCTKTWVGRAPCPSASRARTA